MTEALLTIGELAKRGNVTTSLLRYYEKENLLAPTSRTEAGYRVYSQDALQTLRFIRAAQRYGFSLGDIKLLVRGESEEQLDIIELAEQRFLDIERRATEMLVLRHELELFLEDLSEQVNRRVGGKVGGHYRDLVEQVCGHENHHHHRSSLSQLVNRLNCNLASEDWEPAFAVLRGQPVHIWREDDRYFIQFSTREETIRDALQTIAKVESDCEAHLQPQLIEQEQSLLFSAKGDNAFLYAQLFLALESEQAAL